MTTLARLVLTAALAGMLVGAAAVCTVAATVVILR